MSSIEFQGDHGYFSENTFFGILLSTGCVFICICPRGVWLPFILENAVLAQGDKRMVMPEDGLMTCEVREKKCKSGNHNIDLASIAFRTGTGKAILVASSAHRRLTMDFVTTIEMIGRTWKEDREAFIKLAFSLEFSRSSGIEKEDTHNKFFEVFKAVPMIMVTAFQGHKEWHLALCFGMTSTTTHTLIKALLHHYFALSNQGDNPTWHPKRWYDAPRSINLFLTQ